jgi:hypothetical protein
MIMEMATDLAREGVSVEVGELFSLATMAKNDMHSVRGYTPNQWAYGKSSTVVASVLQDSENMPAISSSMDDAGFQSALERRDKAKHVFLKVDSSRRIKAALAARARTFREFIPGELIYYYRMGKGQQSRTK